MAAASTPALVITHLPDVRYLCGFTGSSAALAIASRVTRLFTDGRYTAQAAEEVKGAKVEIVPSAPATAAVQWLAAQPIAPASIGFDPAQTTVADLDRWKAALPAKLRRRLLNPVASL